MSCDATVIRPSVVELEVQHSQFHQKVDVDGVTAIDWAGLPQWLQNLPHINLQAPTNLHHEGIRLKSGPQVVQTCSNMHGSAVLHVSCTALHLVHIL